MPIVVSHGALQHFAPGAAPFTAAATSVAVSSTSRYTLTHAATYEKMYATQPAVRTCVDFIARNMAQLGLHVYRRVSDTDRQRLNDHQLAQWLRQPNPATTAYRMTESTFADLGVHFAAYWLKVRRADRQVIGHVRLPPASVAPSGWLMPEGFVWSAPNGMELTLPAEDVVYFSGYNPYSAVAGLSPLETLRGRLYEEAAANDYRAAYWQNAARLEGVIQRPLAAPKWTMEQKDAFRAQWQLRHGGSPGLTAVLEDGMTFQATSYSAEESQYTDARKLTREEVAAAYQIPLPMVGILDHATYSNIREQHKQLYQDTLGPWCDMYEQEVVRQMLADCADTDRVYVEFNISEKMKGSFEEQAASLQALVGRPIMTANEGRARLNLPSIKDDPTADQLAMPMNMGPETETAGVAPAVAPRRMKQPAAAALVPVIAAAWTRQRARIEKLPEPDRATVFDTGRFDVELASDLLPLYQAIGCSFREASRASTQLAEQVNTDTVARLLQGDDPFPASREAWSYVDA